MSWFRRIALLLSISSFLILGIALAYNWIEGPGIVNLAGEVKSSDLLQHYGAGRFVREGRASDLYGGGILGLWIYSQHPGQKELKSTSFNYVYPPLVARLAAPFSGVSFLTFALGWLGCSLFFYGLCLSNLIKISKGHEFLFWILLLLGLPSFHYTIILGQNSCLSLLVISSSAWLLGQKKEVAAGLVLSCLFYKPQFLPLLAGFMLMLGHWRFALAAGAGSVAWLVAGLVLCGHESYIAWLQVLQKLNSGEQLQFASLNQTLKMFFLNLMGMASHPGKWLGLGSTLLGLSLFGLAIAVLRFCKPLKEWSAPHSLLLAAAVMTIGSPYLMHYDLLLAAGWWFLCLKEHEDRGWQAKTLAGLFWVISLFSINTVNWPAPATAPLMLIYLGFSLRMYFKDSTGRSRSLEPARS